MMSKIIGLFKSLFKTGKKIEPETNAPSIPNSPRKKIAIIVGHGAGDGGATGFNGVEEYSYNHKVANIVMENVTNHEIKIFYRTASGIAGVASRVVLWQPDMSIELHCNAFDGDFKKGINGTASGCEVLVLVGDGESERLGRSYVKSFKEKFNRKPRHDMGIKFIDKGDRGGASLKAVSPIKQSILVEPFFIDRKEEWIEPLTYAEFLAKWLSEQ